MTDSFHHYCRPGPRRTWTLFRLTWQGSQPCQVDLFSAIYSSFCISIIKFCIFFYLSYQLRLLLIVCGDIESNPGPGSDKRDRVLYSNIRGLHANLDELAVIGSDIDVLVCPEPKVSDRRHLSELLASVAPNRGSGAQLVRALWQRRQKHIRPSILRSLCTVRVFK